MVYAWTYVYMSVCKCQLHVYTVLGTTHIAHMQMCAWEGPCKHECRVQVL